MRVRTPNPRSRNRSVSVWTRSVAFVVATLCLAFTEGQAPPVWQTWTTGDAPKAALDLAGLHPVQVAASVRAQSILADGTFPNPGRRPEIPGNCGMCENFLNQHVAIEYPVPGTGFGEGEHGWHSKWRGGPPCAMSHGLCTTGLGQFAPASAGELTDAIVQAAAEQDASLLAALLTLPDVRANFDRAAIQVAGCDGTTIAGHVPVARDLLAAAQVLATEALD